MKDQTFVRKSTAISERADERGFSLVELLVSIVIFLIVTAAIFGVMQVAQAGRSMVNQQVPLNKSVRLSLNLLGRDTYNAGFGYPLESAVVVPDSRLYPLLGLPPDPDPSRDDVPPIISGNDLHPNNLNPDPGVRTDQVTFLFKDPSFNLVGDPGREVSMPLRINAATTIDGIDEIVPIAGSNSECRVNDLFLVTGNTGSTLSVVTGLSGTDRVQFANGDILGMNLTGTGGTLTNITTPASRQRVRMVTYFVTPNGELTRRDFANRPPPATPAAFVDEVLVYGVEDFQIEYVMDDGSITPNPELERLIAVRQVRFTITVRGTEVVADPNEVLRITMTSTFSTRNLGYDAS